MSETTTDTTATETVENNNSTETTQNEVTDYKSLYEKTKTERDSFFTELKGFKSKATQAEKEKVKASTDVEQVRSWADDEIKTRDDRYNSLVQNLVDSNLSREVTAALAEAKGNAKLLTTHMMSQIKGEFQEDGSVKVTVLGEDGNPLLVRGRPATIKDLVTRMKESDDFSIAFEGSGATGGGSTNVVNTAMAPSVATENPWMANSKHVGKQMEIENRDPALAKKLKAEAEAKSKR